jgi:hypothetical protein
MGYFGMNIFFAHRFARSVRSHSVAYMLIFILIMYIGLSFIARLAGYPLKFPVSSPSPCNVKPQPSKPSDDRVRNYTPEINYRSGSKFGVKPRGLRAKKPYLYPRYDDNDGDQVDTLGDGLPE